MARARLIVKKATLTFPVTLVAQNAIIKLVSPIIDKRLAFKLAQVQVEWEITGDNADDEINYRRIDLYNQRQGTVSAGTTAQRIQRFVRAQWKYTQTAVGVAGYIENFPAIWNPPSNFLLYGEQLRVEMTQANTAAVCTANVSVLGYEIAITELEYIQFTKDL